MRFNIAPTICFNVSIFFDKVVIYEVFLIIFEYFFWVSIKNLILVNQKISFREQRLPDGNPYENGLDLNPCEKCVTY